MEKDISICGTIIRGDHEGRFSLNDLHLASGSDPISRPSQFLRSKKIKELIDACDRNSNAHNCAFKSVRKTKGRYGGGTWIVKELVIAYAMWVNADFALKVIRVFDAVVSGDYAKVEDILGGEKGINEVCSKRDSLSVDKSMTAGQKVDTFSKLKNEYERIRRDNGRALRANIGQAAKFKELENAIMKEVQYAFDI